MKDASDAFTPPERGRFGDNEQAPPRAAPRVTGASNLVDVKVHLRCKSEAAIAVIRADQVSAKWIWLPRSLIEYRRLSEQSDATLIEVTLPDWLAREKGLV